MLHESVNQNKDKIRKKKINGEEYERHLPIESSSCKSQIYFLGIIISSSS